jgi:hypothetical protein
MSTQALIGMVDTNLNRLSERGDRRAVVWHWALAKGSRIPSRWDSCVGENIRFESVRFPGPVVEERRGNVCYISGIPTMTDEFVENAKKADGVVEANVLSEKIS